MANFVDPKGKAGSNGPNNSLPNGRLTGTDNRKGQVFDQFEDPETMRHRLPPTDSEVKQAGGQRLADVQIVHHEYQVATTKKVRNRLGSSQKWWEMDIYVE